MKSAIFMPKPAFLKRVHGSALFCRGETQVLAMTTLATPEGKQLVENMEGTVKKRFMLNYNFPVSQPEKQDAPIGDPAAEKSATAHWLRKPSPRCCPPKKNFLMQSASLPKLFPRTALPLWLQLAPHPFR